ncbi:glycosyltransferase family 4 protein [Candidatus Woesearchaeota archaeon]|nr:glycosyltransferase family 4 protein [Candidatus Woesearchaeota archaeon]
MEKKNIAVIASRLKCIDAISVEADHWIDKYSKLGYNVHLIAGKFGEPVELQSFELPEMDYKHPEIRGLKRIVFGAQLNKDGKKAADILVNNLVKRIKGPLKNYLLQNKIDLLSIEDALASMKNLPLNIALRQIVEELKIPTISRYHYLPWDNPYFSKHNNFPKITEQVPPNLKNIIHITNTFSAKQKLNEKRKIISKVVPNTIDLDQLQNTDLYNKDLRKDLGIGQDQLIFIQPTRVKRNKCIEKSIKLVAEINDIMKKDNVLIVTGSPVYSRGNYFEEIVKRAKKQNVNMILANDRIFLARHMNTQQKFYSMHDAYVHADVVLYPNTGDAFGNPVIEAAAYRKPLVVNTFPNTKEFLDKGFRFVVMDQKVTNEVISDLYELIADKAKLTETVEHNHELLKKHYSSDILDEALIPVLNSLEQQQSLLSRMADRFIPDRFIPDKFRKKKEKFKGSKNRKEPDLKNKKGGYKEPK